eukprot:CAMPEP_0171074010 /NCGR_PEP_ID=MMETSP0766_2-20121228/11871_1 /TAXON_ID=439317 /ORGANISM="Gambierdiscus australes, Strain CAWD 149" /LENGTH=52 /DNA_ID=CAMNT_0011530755 /DNA_START=95 /DNA_END=253 /DNA_ORIENTATION=-
MWDEWSPQWLAARKKVRAQAVRKQLRATREPASRQQTASCKRLRAAWNLQAA